MPKKTFVSERPRNKKNAETAHLRFSIRRCRFRKLFENEHVSVGNCRPHPLRRTLHEQHIAGSKHDAAELIHDSLAVTVYREHGQVERLTKTKRFQRLAAELGIRKHDNLEKLRLFILELRVVEHELRLYLEPALFFYAKQV